MVTRLASLTVVVALLFAAVTAHGQQCGDLDNSGQIEASDALLLLNKAVDQPVPDLICPLSAGLAVTGQTTCYDATEGVVIDCAGTGQDGELQRGAARSFTDNGDGTITDNVTGLMWEKLSDDGSIHDGDNLYTWTDAVTTKVATLNATSFGGYTDWRLPNRVELGSLVNAATTRPATYSVFNTGCVASCTVLTCNCTLRSRYWSSTTFAEGPQYAWSVTFEPGNVEWEAKSFVAGVRAVRGGL